MAAIKRAKDAGYETIDLGADLEGEAREIAAETKIGVEKKLPKAKGNAGPGRGKAGAKAGRAFDDAPHRKSSVSKRAARADKLAVMPERTAPRQQLMTLTPATPRCKPQQ